MKLGLDLQIVNGKEVINQIDNLFAENGLTDGVAHEWFRLLQKRNKLQAFSIEVVEPQRVVFRGKRKLKSLVDQITYSGLQDVMAK